jgi:RimJ/RimL family protein N-acetyltransferase
VVLRAFRPSELDALVDQFRSDDGAAAGIAGPSRAKLRRRIAGSGRWDRGWINFGIEAGGRLIGDIQARGYPREAMPPGVIDIGLTLFASADRGKGYGTTALKLLTRWLLGPGGVSRVQGSTAVTNKAMQRSFEKAGYKREGVLRSFMPGPRGRVDYLLYAKTKP